MSTTSPDTIFPSKQPDPDSVYRAYLKQADQFYKEQKYTECLRELEKARELKPDMPSLQERIIRVKGLIAQQKKTSEEYGKIIPMADGYFARKDYLNAKASYQMAIDVKSDDAYAKEKLKETMDLLRLQKAQHILYDVAVAGADKLFDAGEYEKAKQEYENALKIMPRESYPREKINLILKIQIDAMTREELYKTAVAAADRYVEAKSYQNALLEYKNALKQKPDEVYPKQRIEELNTILDQLRTIDEAYKQAIARADELFVETRYADSRKKYEEALAFKPLETYPADRIREIDRITAGITRANAEFESVINEADSLYIARDFSRAYQKYQQALLIKPGESYPKSMLVKTQTGVNDQEINVPALDGSYQTALKNADRLLADKAYEEGKADQRILTEQYEKLIGIADQAFTAKLYDSARIAFSKAGELKPEQTYWKDRIAEIDLITAEIQKRNEDYQSAVAKGDELLAYKHYVSAREEYQNAATIRPAESYPKEKISEINQILSEIEGKKQTYNKLVSRGDQFLSMKEYSRAKEEYLLALDLFPEEVYPKDQIRFSTTRIDSIYRANKADYDKAIGEGDGFFNTFEYDRSIDAFTRALSFLPAEEYPRDMIAKIRKTIAENTIADVLNKPVIIKAGEELKFTFNPVNIATRRNNFIYLRVKNLSETPFNVLLRYGKDEKTSGGTAIRNILPGEEMNERLISVKDQDPWYREDNNWISLYPQGGDIEVSFIQVSRAIN